MALQESKPGVSQIRPPFFFFAFVPIFWLLSVADTCTNTLQIPLFWVKVEQSERQIYGAGYISQLTLTLSMLYPSLRSLIVP